MSHTAFSPRLAVSMAFYQKQLKDSKFGAEYVLKGKLPNVAMESFFGTLNLKCFHTCWYASVAELESALHKYIRYYNHGGIKLKSQELSSVQYRLQSSKVAWLNCPTSWSQFNESSSIFRFPSNNVLDRKNSPYRVKWRGIYYCSKTC